MSVFRAIWFATLRIRLARRGNTSKYLALGGLDLAIRFARSPGTDRAAVVVSEPPTAARTGPLEVGSLPKPLGFRWIGPARPSPHRTDGWGGLSGGPTIAFGGASAPHTAYWGQSPATRTPKNRLSRARPLRRSPLEPSRGRCLQNRAPGRPPYKNPDVCN